MEIPEDLRLRGPSIDWATEAGKGVHRVASESRDGVAKEPVRQLWCAHMAGSEGDLSDEPLWKVV